MAAIYQWFRGYVDYDYVLYSTDALQVIRYLHFDFNTGIYTDFGRLDNRGASSVITDKTNVIGYAVGGGVGLRQHVWRGNTFSRVAEYVSTAGNAPDQCSWFIGNPGFMLLNGTEDFKHGGRTVGYSELPPYSFGPEFPCILDDPSGADDWAGFYDINYGNRGDRGYGDIVVTLPAGANENMVVCTPYPNGSLNKGHRLLSPVGSSASGWTHDPQSGLLAMHKSGSQHGGTHPEVHFFQVNMSSLESTYIGWGTTAEDVWAVGLTPNGFVVTLEHLDSVMTLRAYSRVDDSLTLTDSLFIAGDAVWNTTMQISRTSGRVWMMGAGSIGTKILHVEDDGTIVIDFSFDFSTAGTGYIGQPIAFFDAPLTITTNGFTGTKEKLYECWEMEEEGSVPRVGSMGNVTLVPDGTVDHIIGTIGNAADFDTSALVLDELTEEVATVSSFSICLDIVIDSKGADNQSIISRNAEQAGIGIDALKYDWRLKWDQSIDRFTFSVYYRSTEYTAIAADLGSIVIGQKYHIYLEYDKVLDQISIVVDDGDKNTTGLPIGTTINRGWEVTKFGLFLGRLSTHASEYEYLDGSIDQVYWFWDILTADEITWMYNLGNSRAFSEL